MPSCITHQLIGEAAKAAFPPQIKTAASDREDYFFLGTQGPDALFFLQPLSKKQFNLGRLLHRRHVYETFSFFRRYGETLSGEEAVCMRAYFAGYLCHYAADVVFHPFVYAYLNANETRGMEHQRIETDWDEFFVRKLFNRSSERWNFPFSAKEINRDGCLFRLYTALSEQLKRSPPPRRTFERAMKRYERYLRFFHKKSQYGAWTRIERFLHLKPRVSCFYPRPEGAQTEKVTNADEAFSRAAGESARLTQLFFAGDLSREAFNKNLLSGKEIK